jgi:hypothetical protein
LTGTNSGQERYALRGPDKEGGTLMLLFLVLLGVILVATGHMILR